MKKETLYLILPFSMVFNIALGGLFVRVYDLQTMSEFPLLLLLVVLFSLNCFIVKLSVDAYGVNKNEED